MKSYIISLLQKASFCEAKKLYEIFVHYYVCFEYIEKGSFECFYLHVPKDYELYDFFHKYESKGEQEIEGTPICWRVVRKDELQIWLK